jgi:pilus assembly protein Flp/PilA
MENQDGVTAIEYGLIAALIAVAAVVVMGTVGTNLSGVFSQVASSRAVDRAVRVPWPPW